MRDLVIVGLGELGRLYGAGALAAGFRVTPVLRGVPVPGVLETLAPRTPLLIAVSEPSLGDVLAAVPQTRQGDAILLQNELFPTLWRDQAEAPTLMVPWVLKKQGTPQIVIRATPAFGRHADVVVAMHAALGIDCVILDDEAALARELVHKYAFILTISALGVWREGTLGGWLDEEPMGVRNLAAEACRLGARLAGVCVEESQAIAAVLHGMQALASVPARGRWAASRVLRAQSAAKRLDLTLPLLQAIVVEPSPLVTSESARAGAGRVP